MIKYFDYIEAFSRNLGWLSEYEQIKLKNSCVAIAGMGGVGGIYFLTCVRLGIEKFNLADFDQFELGNFNRQVGASFSTIGKSKLDVMIQQGLDINPNLQITRFSQGINSENIDEFLLNANIYLDGIDFFEMETRRLIFKKCRENDITAVTAAPVGMGFAQMIFTPKSPSFDDFFNFDAYPQPLHPVVFMMGLAPKNIHAQAIHDESRIHFERRKVTSTIMGCALCAGSAVTEVFKHLLGRGRQITAPCGIHYDAHSNKLKKTRLFWGNKGPIQRLKIFIARKMLLKKNAFPYPHDPLYQETDLLKPIQEILDFAKWAPSGHNEQLCKVHVLGADQIRIAVDLPNLPLDQDDLERISLENFGIYLESIRQASSLKGYSIAWKASEQSRDFVISFHPNPDVKPESTAIYLRARFTDRRVYKRNKIDLMSKKELQDLMPQGYKLMIWESFRERLDFARQECRAFSIQSKDPIFLEAMTHSIQSDNDFPLQGMPLRSLALNPMNRFFSHILMKRPKLMSFLNRLGGYIPVMIDYSLLRNLRCAGHFMIVKENSPDGKVDYIENGQIIQRFWLAATKLGLVLQPAYLQLFIARNDVFQNHHTPLVRKRSRRVKQFLLKCSGAQEAFDVVFMGRIGEPTNRKVYARSMRFSQTEPRRNV